MSGQGGADVLLGGSFGEKLRGGAGDDQADGGKGADKVALGSGTDSAIYDKGDGSDRVRGGTGADSLSVRGTSGNDSFSLLPGAAGHVKLNGNTDLEGIETAAVAALGGDDELTAGCSRCRPFRSISV